MPDATSLTFAASPNSTQSKPMVNINGSDYDPAAIETAIRMVRQMLPTDTFSRTVSAFTPTSSVGDKVPVTLKS